MQFEGSDIVESQNDRFSGTNGFIEIHHIYIYIFWELLCIGNKSTVLSSINLQATQE